MPMFDDLFRKKRLIPEKLSAYGFEYKEGHSFFQTEIMGKMFTLTVIVTENGAVNTRLIEKVSGEEYVLYKTNAVGAFVGDVRAAVENVLVSITESCYESAVFQTEQSQAVIRFVRDSYGDELEFLWPKFPNNAVWRRKDNRKWYGTILTVPKNRLGFDSAELVEIIDLRLQPDDMDELVSKDHYYPGWHMNKKHWFTMLLDGSVTNGEMFDRIRKSYELAKK